MAIYFYSNNELVLYELGDILNPPIRAEFLVSDDLNETLEVTIEFADDEIEDLVLPFVATIDDKHYYSFSHKLIKSVDNTIPGVDEETPTPTITPSLSECVSSPVTITVESEYISAGNSIYKYITSDSSEAGGLFGCINAERGSRLTIFVDGDEPNLVLHPIKITEFRNDGNHGTPRTDVVKTDLTEGQTEDHTYSLTWVVPCDETIDKYQYQCEEHAHMRGTINVFGECEHTPTPSPTHTPTITNYEEEPIDEYIYDSMEAVSIIGGDMEGQSVVGYNDRQLTTFQGVNGVTGLTLENNIVTLTETGRYYIKARTSANKSESTYTAIKFLSGDYANEEFLGPRRYARQNMSQMVICECSVVVDITQTTTFKIQTKVGYADAQGLSVGESNLFVQKLASVDGGSSSSNGSSSGNAIIQQGTYTGNSTENNAEQFINLGFTPIRVEIFGRNEYKTHAILLKDKTDNLVSWRDTGGSHDDHRSYSATSIIVENGFKVANNNPANASHLNYNDVEFDYYVTAEGNDASSSGGSSSSNGSSTTSDATLSFNVFPRVDSTDLSEITIKCKNDYLKSVDPVNNNIITNITKFDVVDTTEASSLTSTTISHTNLFFVINDTLYYVTDDDGASVACTVGELSSIEIYTDYNPSTPQIINFLVSDIEITFTGNQNNPVLVEHINGYKSFVRNGTTLSDGGSSPQSGGIGDLAEVIAQSNFDGILPDRIILTDNTNQIVPYTLSYVKSTYIEYAFSADTINTNLHIRFNNDPSGTLKEKTTGHELYTGDTTLQDIIDNGHAIYLGGSSSASSTFASLTDTPSELSAGKYIKVNDEGNGIEFVDAPSGGSSSSGGIGENPNVQALSNFDSIIPDQLIVNQTDNSGKSVFAFRQIHSGKIQYRDEWSGDAYITFDNDSTGSNISISNSVYTFNAGVSNLQDAIDNDHAVYLGGSSSGGSSTSNVVSAIIEADGTITSSSDDWIESIDATVGGNVTINFVSGYFTQTPSIATSVAHQSASHIDIEHANLTKDSVLILQRGKLNTSYTVNGQFTIIAQHQDRVSGSSSASSTFASLTDTPSELSAGKYIKVNDEGNGIEFVDAPSGGSSSSGMGSLAYLKNEYGTGDVRMRFYTDLPDAIVTKDGDGGGALWDMRLELTEIAIWDGQLQAYYIRASGGYNIRFDLNTADGDYINDTEVDEDDVSDDASLKDYIEGGRALYYGGSSSNGSSSSGASNIVTGNYTGTGEASQPIELGFRPAMVHVKCTSAPYYGEMTQIDGLEGTSLRSYHTLNNSDDGFKIEITDTGFIATGKDNNSTFNHNESAYYYYAISSSSGASSSGASSSSASSVTIPDSCYAFIKEDGTISRKSDNWDDYVQEVKILTTDPNGYYRIIYKSEFFNYAPIVIATADHKDNASQPHIIAQTQAMNTTQADIVIGDANGLQTPSQFNVVIYSPQIKSTIALQTTSSSNGSSSSGSSSSASSSIEFSKCYFQATSVGHGGKNISLDEATLVNQSSNWIYEDTTNNIIGLRPPKDGLYNISSYIHVNGVGARWNDSVSYLDLSVNKRNITTDVVERIGLDTENKGSASVGAYIDNSVNENFVYLTTNEYIYVSYGGWVSSAGQSTFHPIATDKSYLELSSVNVASSSSDSSDGGFSTSESDILANGTMKVSSQISSLENSIGISSVTRTALGTFKFTLTTPIQDAEYNVFANTIGSSICVAFVMSKTANDFTIETRRIDHANNISIADVDANLQFVVIAK